MKNKEELKLEIRKDIGNLSRIIHDLSMKYKKEPGMKDAQKALLSLSVNIGRALNIPMQ